MLYKVARKINSESEIRDALKKGDVKFFFYVPLKRSNILMYTLWCYLEDYMFSPSCFREYIAKYISKSNYPYVCISKDEPREYYDGELVCIDLFIIGVTTEQYLEDSFDRFAKSLLSLKAVE